MGNASPSCQGYRDRRLDFVSATITGGHSHVSRPARNVPMYALV